MLNKHQYKINLLVLLLISQQNETCNRIAIKQTATMVAVITFNYKTIYQYRDHSRSTNFILNSSRLRYWRTAISDAVKIKEIKEPRPLSQFTYNVMKGLRLWSQSTEKKLTLSSSTVKINFNQSSANILELSSYCPWGFVLQIIPRLKNSSLCLLYTSPSPRDS